MRTVCNGFCMSHDCFRLAIQPYIIIHTVGENDLWNDNLSTFPLESVVVFTEMSCQLIWHERALTSATDHAEGMPVCLMIWEFRVFLHLFALPLQNMIWIDVDCFWNSLRLSCTAPCCELLWILSLLTSAWTTASHGQCNQLRVASRFANKFWEWVSSHRKGTTTLSFDNWLHLWRKPLDIQLKRCLPEPLQERAFPILNASNVAQRTHPWANERSQVVTTVPEFESGQCPTGSPMKILMTFLVCETSTSRI